MTVWIFGTISIKSVCSEKLILSFFAHSNERIDSSIRLVKIGRFLLAFLCRTCLNVCQSVEVGKKRNLDRA
jgi:hypothetical protein